MSSRSPSSSFDSSFTDERIETLIDLDLVFGSLAHRRRREVLSLLDEQPEWTRKTLAKRLAESRPTSCSPTEVEISLVHNHFQNLEAANLIDRDRGSSMIRQGYHYGIVRAMVDAVFETVEK